tara:strand:+ start:10803 stop:11339 length:537 start_codon:yes stop_codon:yes gene_type:complete
MALTKLNYTGQGTVPHAKMPSGTVLQTLISEFNTPSTFAQNNSVNTSTDIHSLAITPKFSTSKILVRVKVTASGNATTDEWSCGVKRGSTKIGGNTDPSSLFLGDNIGAAGFSTTEGPLTLMFETLDSPATTSATTYTSFVYGGETADFYINRGKSTNNARLWANSGNCSITLMEIAA